MIPFLLLFGVTELSWAGKGCSAGEDRAGQGENVTGKQEGSVICTRFLQQRLKIGVCEDGTLREAGDNNSLRLNTLCI